jgi:TP901 family phage tail tape measure protein
MAKEKILAFRVDVVGASKEAEQLAKIDIELKKLNEERKETLKIAAKTEKQQKEQAKQLAVITSKTKELQAKKAQLNRTEKLNNQVVQTQAGSIARLRAETAKMRKEADNLNLENKEGRQRYEQLTKAIQRNQKTIRDHDRRLSGSKTLVGEYGKGGVQAFRAITAGIIAAVAAFRTFSRVLGGGVKDFAAFERGQANVQTLLDSMNSSLSGQSIKLIRQYGLEIENTNKALFDAVSAGVPVGESIEFLDKANRLAVGGVTDLSSAVDGLTSVLNGYGLGLDQADRVAAAFFSAQKFGKTTVAELTKEIGKVVPIGAQLDVTYQEILATYAQLTKQGIRTEESTTAIRNTMIALLKPSREAAEKFDELGIAYGATNVKQEGFLKVLSQISTAVENGDADLAELIPNIRALTGAGALGTRQLEEMQGILEIVNNDFGEGSSLARAYNVQMETTAKSMERIKSAFKTGRLAIGETLAPLIKGFADLVNPVQKTSEAIREQQVRLNSLAIAAQNANEDTDLRLRLIETLNEEYPDFLGNLDAEKVTNEELAGRLRDVNELYVQKIKVAVGEELYKRQADTLADLLELEEQYATSIGETEFAIEELKKERDNYYRELIEQTDDIQEKERLTAAIRDDTWYQADASITRAYFAYQQYAGQLSGAQTLLTANRDAQEEINERIIRQLELLGTEKALLEQLNPTPKPGGGKKDPPGGKPQILEVELDEQSFADYQSIYLDLLEENEKSYADYQSRLEDLDEEGTKKMVDTKVKEWNREIQEFQRKEKLKNQIFQNSQQAITGLFDVAFARNNKNMELELKAAGDNEEKKEEIRRRYAKKEQKIALKEALMNSALMIIQAALTKPFIPAGLIAAGIASVMSGIQIATIKQTKFASGGIVPDSAALPGAKPGTDSVPAMLTPGEVILNKRQQNLIGGPSAFRRAGVPGFASGGRVPLPSTAKLGAGNADLANMINSLEVTLNVNKLEKAQKEVAVINQTSRL